MFPLLPALYDAVVGTPTVTVEFEGLGVIPNVYCFADTVVKDPFVPLVIVTSEELKSETFSLNVNVAVKALPECNEGEHVSTEFVGYSRSP